MEFDFLPKLPSSNLDDRTFDELVEECILRIPRYCPEWTDHNISDPGITLIELFAWLTDQMLLRFNRIPRKNYVAFLELLGIRLQSPAPAQTDLTFYLSTDLDETYTIPAGVEVATERTETTEAIVFTTDRALVIGKPKLRNFLTSQTLEDHPQTLRDRVTSQWTHQSNGNWEGREQLLFEDQPKPGNCFYLVLDPEEPLEGNVLRITFRGAAATSTGINPNRPPRTWEAWDGEHWQPVLLQEADDETRGFSFYEIAQQGRNPAQGADVVLHLPQTWPTTNFNTYRGRWLRCVFTTPDKNQPGYTYSPRIIGLSVGAIGGTVNASHNIIVRNERLGISNGKPGQTFQLQSAPILERQENEYILVTPPNGLPQKWQEVRDFADSSLNDPHYTIDSLTGKIQFGPLIREPDSLKRQTQIRSRIQQPTKEDWLTYNNTNSEPSLENQYGAVPPPGAEIKIVAYRLGGGRKGNVQSGTLRFLRTAIPYVTRVTNHRAAHNGSDAETLEQAVLRAPQILRTRDRAVTVEDFETLTLQASAGAIARVRCLPPDSSRAAGTVSLLVVPEANTEAIVQGVGIAPDQLVLEDALKQKILRYLDDRRLLGVQVQLGEPEYIGVSVRAQVALESAYNHPNAQQEILFNLRLALYRYLNPITGGPEGKGWPFGRPVYPSDIIALLQQTPGVRYLGPVLLFPIHKQGQTWIRQKESEPYIDPGLQGLVCSWADSNLRSGHDITLLTP
ncbi:putative baseplate assembly protein [Nostoc sp. FACHB-152]|uniref:putative baseplate assembly protein n=1 Tax=unclassified Nostoc TaxID=2593658 RepID=UPI0016867968|nr:MULTISPECIES: putative baseplate assembly protein [unclassified Nostoc]MBD2449734.1 putative baseplate assembly protein [Nostoc sp. FACHB-152]MBD2469889.1 putative baseplate assembly protein [Nostoc sp. FACHB-145]